MPSSRPRAIPLAVALAFAVALPAANAAGQAPYKLPPREIVDILDAPPIPSAIISPDKQYLLLVEMPSLPPVAEVGQPMLRLAGLRINPHTNGSARANGHVSGLLVKR